MRNGCMKSMSAFIEFKFEYMGVVANEKFISCYSL